LYFDTFFTTDGSSVAPDAQVQLAREDDLHLAEVWPLGTGLGRRRSSQPHPVSPVLEPLTPPKPGMPRKPSLKHVASGNKQTVEEKAPSSPPAHRRRASLGDGLVNKTASFSTGPWSIPTHWKQTLFLLREPIFVEEGVLEVDSLKIITLTCVSGTIVSGTFYLRKSSENKRELDVEIHYEVTHPVDSSGDIDRPKRKSQKGTTIQMFKVR
jgi:type I protein arginine methyltransferase